MACKVHRPAHLRAGVLNPKHRWFTVWLTLIAWTQKDRPSDILFGHLVTNRMAIWWPKGRWWVLKLYTRCNQTPHKLHSPLSDIFMADGIHAERVKTSLSCEEADVEKWNKTKQRPISRGRGACTTTWTRAWMNYTYHSKMFFGPTVLFTIRGNRNPNWLIDTLLRQRICGRSNRPSPSRK